jgi:hypothetical protein
MSARQTVTIRRDEAFEHHPQLGRDFTLPKITLRDWQAVSVRSRMTIGPIGLPTKKDRP